MPAPNTFDLKFTFDENVVSSITYKDYYGGSHTINNSEETGNLRTDTGGASEYVFNVSLKNGYVIDNVIMEGDGTSYFRDLTFDENSFKFTGGGGSGTINFNIITKLSTTKEVKSIRYNGKEIRKINGKELRALVFNGFEYVIKRSVTDITSLSWPQIINAANSGLIQESCVGQEKTITIDSTSYDVILIGVNHDDLVSGGKANTTWQLKNCYNTEHDITGASHIGYDSSDMYIYTLPSIFNLIQEDIRNAIKPVVKKTSAGDESTIIVDINCNLFLLSEVEIFGETICSVSGEGERYAYRSQFNRPDYMRKGKQSSPTDYIPWWERSPYASNAYDFCLVNSYGEPTIMSAYFTYGVSFAFCI